MTEIDLEEEWQEEWSMIVPAYYTTAGEIRGSCGHRHRSADTAEACRARDQRECARWGGCSDRQVVAVWPDGTRSIGHPHAEVEVWIWKGAR